MFSHHRLWSVSLVLLAALAWVTNLSAQQPHRAPGGYDPIQAGQDAFEYHEQQRLRDVNRHLMLQDELRWWAGWPGGAACGRPWAARLDALYAYGLGVRDRFGPGATWGYRLYDGVPQSIGQAHIQTGPNRWESHPVYPGTRFPAPAPTTGAVGGELRPGERVAAPAATPSRPPAGESRGPVEF